MTRAQRYRCSECDSVFSRHAVPLQCQFCESAQIKMLDQDFLSDDKTNPIHVQRFIPPDNQEMLVYVFDFTSQIRN